MNHSFSLLNKVMDKQSHKTWVVIPAAGLGMRFAGLVPKQYYQVQGKTLLEYTLDLFLAQPWCEKIVIVLSAQDDHFGSLSVAEHPKIQRVLGASHRAGSVFEGLKALNKVAKPKDWIVVHDAVRPCCHPDDINGLLQLLIACDDPVGGILSAAVHDTLKKVAGGHIAQTLSRDEVICALTPQIFRYQVLYDAMKQSLHLGLTDESASVERAGYPVKTFMAQHPNPKLTLSADLVLIKALLACA